MLTLAICAALWLFAACAGSSTPIAPTGNDAALADQSAYGFGDLPAPREVSVGESVLDVSGGTRSFLQTTAIYFGPQEPGVSQDSPDFHLVFEPTTDEQLTYTIFPLFDPLEDQVVSLGQISLEMEWYGDTPQDDMGFYVGVPDYANNRWAWRRPAQSTADILDFSEDALKGNPAEFGFDKLALVNYSDVEVKLRYIGLTTIHPDDVTGDERIFFITKDDGSYAINSALTSDLDSAAPIIEGGPGVELANLHIIEGSGEPILVFDRRANGGHWEVWQADLDGIVMQQRYSGEQDVRFSAAAPDGSYEFTVQGDGPMRYADLLGYQPGSPTPDMSFELPGELMDSGGSWYAKSAMPNVALVVGGIDEEGRPAVMYYSWSDFLQQGFFNPMVYLGEGEAAYDPFHFTWNDSDSFFTPIITLYSFSAAGDDTNEIRAAFLGLPASQNNRPFVSDDSYSLRYPSVSADSRLLSVVACMPDADSGELYIQSSFLRELDHSAAVAGNVIGNPAWYDPTPPVFATE
jgi:hypothetical protein